MLNWLETTFDVSTLFWIAAYGLNAYVIVKAVSSGHGVEGTLAWVFAMVALPGLGAVLYLLLANPYVKRTTRRKRRKAAVVRSALAYRARNFPESPQKELTASILSLASSLTGLMPSAGNEVELLTENLGAFQRIGDALRAARKSIWSEYYLIRNDETGKRFLDILAEKARAGVEVRLIYDAVGSLGLDAERLRILEAAGGRVEEFLPLNPLRRRWSIHLRNHRKIIIVDGEVAFTGGMNVGDEYSGRARRKGLQTFHDTHLALRGPAVADLALVFAEDWSFAAGEPIAPTPHGEGIPGAASVVGIVPSGPDQEHNANGMVYFTGIASAREKVYLASPYFIPDEPTLRALISAALRGVDVRVLVPAKNDVGLVGFAARSYFRALLRGGVRVFRYLPSMLHAKTMVVDGAWGMVGSANVDIRSFRLNFELGAIVVDPVFIARLEQRFLADLKDSAEVTLDSLARRSFPEKLRDGLARLLSPIL